MGEEEFNTLLKLLNRRRAEPTSISMNAAMSNTFVENTVPHPQNGFTNFSDQSVLANQQTADESNDAHAEEMDFTYEFSSSTDSNGGNRLQRTEQTITVGYVSSSFNGNGQRMYPVYNGYASLATSLVSVSETGFAEDTKRGRGRPRKIQVVTPNMVSVPCSPEKEASTSETVFSPLMTASNATLLLLSDEIKRYVVKNIRSFTTRARRVTYIAMKKSRESEGEKEKREKEE